MSSTTPREWVTLGSGEEVVWSGRPSPYLVKYWIGVTVGVFLAGLLTIWILPTNWHWIGWLVVLGAVGVGAYAYVLYQSVVYVITSEKVYRRRGLLHKSIDTIRLDRIQNVTFTQTFLQRLVDCGDMKLDTAGSGKAEMRFRSVPDPSYINGLLVDGMADGRRQPTSP
ncbi:PH domain-containing protein [Haloarchaeobius sp. HRN-SO-5]|uniref:PH domain-containing protein n=1 Tax=Haloarchaeobius sp. HRN-SO-5 TaxID=3446118 RepID=UPI003EC0D6B2